jgi:DNA polymerase
MSRERQIRSYLENLNVFEDEIYQPPLPDPKPRELRILSDSFSPLPESLEAFEREICACQKCPLGKTRTKFVFGDGSPQARIVFVGEAPGREEDQTGIPFVGRAGKLLDQMLAEVNLDRRQVYICNTLKCRPPGNRDPEQSERATCRPYLRGQLSLISPDIIVCLGKHAALELLGVDQPMGSLRGRVLPWEGMQALVTYHPAYYLRNMAQKIHGEADFRLLRKLFDELPPR